MQSWSAGTVICRWSSLPVLSVSAGRWRPGCPRSHWTRDSLATSVSTQAKFKYTSNRRGSKNGWIDQALENCFERLRVVTDTTREFPTPQINVSFSQPGVHFVGIYSAWNGECKYTRDPPLHVIVGTILTCVVVYICCGLDHNQLCCGLDHNMSNCIHHIF